MGNEIVRLDESLRRWNIDAEAAIHQILGKYLAPGHILIDVGANFGLHTLYAAKAVGPQGCVFAFEPVPTNLNLLRRNVAINHVQQQVKIIPKAVSNSTDLFLDFFVPPETVAVTASLSAESTQSQTKIQVANVRLDDFWPPLNLPVNLIKIDVEGAELEVLRGAEQLLRQWHPPLLIEVHGFALPSFGASVVELRGFLNRLNYQETLLEGEQFQGEDYFQALYLHSEEKISCT
ncbi:MULTISPECIES: FkbM family methyltransferase [Trichocoleus]|uniref:FkbM family methyltransferase n=1 Tax=Trichocoleus desertorum GB2-A4 TaxID=2933944 RepID=A0ABV0J7B1_9CYAN|nr:MULTISPECIES: FkbM family methyltransferase [unclassified Trichocoleus]MBD1862623.1 FkbM family methyltransferase [Trichocoleus sp. FACHB-46]MBD2121674.1 FkbM family methyltransferase [Trichocoleus sp. FACHB-262]